MKKMKTNWLKKCLAIVLSATLVFGIVPSLGVGATEVMADASVNVEDAKAVEALKKLIEALPTVDDVKEMTTEEANEVYQQTQEAYDAYDSLSDADKKLADGDRITALLEYFNTLVAPVEDVPAEVSSFEQLKSNVENGISVKLTENSSAGAGDIYYNSGNTITIEMGEHTINWRFLGYWRRNC